MLYYPSVTPGGYGIGRQSDHNEREEIMTRLQRHNEAARIAYIRQYTGERVIAARVEHTLARAIRARMGERDARKEIRNGTSEGA